MGEVFRATDPRIGRDVAIKVLPESVVSSPDRLRRFEQEARAAGSLNHPNLVTIYDVGTHEGAPYIVMELLEGETLRDKIGEAVAGRAPSPPRIPVRKAVEYAGQMASGLAAAHEKGIIHRDLKPENVFVTRDGRVKILDFGLAKLSGREEAGEEDRTQQRNTSPGTVLGTAGYMSPEQVRGLAVDQRTDIFSFGAILYEMLSSRRAFRHDSAVETMNAILTADPEEMSGSNPAVGSGLDRLVRRCLEKNPDERFRDAHDLAFALEAVSGSQSGTAAAQTAPGPSPRLRRSSRLLLLACAATALVAMVVSSLIAYRRGRSAAAPPALQFTPLTFDAGIESDPAMAPDGKTFAFVKKVDTMNHIFVQRVDGRSAIDITKEADGSEPMYSPDGNQIVFRSERDGGGIFVMGATGESVRRLTNDGFEPAWSPDGTEIIFQSERPVEPTSRQSVSRLSVVALATGARREFYGGDAMHASWSPHGKRVAFWAINNAGRRDIYTIGAEGGKQKAVAATADTPLDWDPVWSPDGRFLYFASDRGGTMNLWRLPIDEESGSPRGEAQPMRTPSPYASAISISRDGTRMVYVSSSRTSVLYGMSFDAATEKVAPHAQPLMAGSFLIRAATPSPDGKMVVFTNEGTPEDLYVMRGDGTDVRQLTSDPARDRGAEWFADSTRILFYSNRGKTYDAWSIRPDGSGLTQLTEGLGVSLPILSQDGKRLAYFDVTNGKGGRVADLSSIPATKSVSLPPIPGAPEAFQVISWSPSGKLAAGASWQHPGLYVFSFADQRYRLIDQEAIRGVFLDENRIAFYRRTPRPEVGVFDLEKNALRAIQTIDLPDFEEWGRLGSVWFSSNGRFLLARPTHSESDVWLTTIGEGGKAAESSN
jgi:Tol biopolymer transport system component